MNTFTLFEGRIFLPEAHSPFEKDDLPFKKGERKGE
jgi:hypothetical protein